MFKTFGDIALPIPVAETFTYELKGSGYEPGMLVDLKFRKKQTQGILLKVHNAQPEFETEAIESPGPVVVTEDQIALALWMAEYYLAGPGEALSKMFPAPSRSKHKEAKQGRAKKQGMSAPRHVLNAEQADAFSKIISLSKAGERKHLLQGITGSGKTEVYVHLLAHSMQNGGRAILIVPEISLTLQMVERLREVFGDEIALLHSGLKPKERWEAYASVLRNERRIAVGTRSAIFAPLRPDLIIIDEEHDGSYKEHSTPRYDARFIADHLSDLYGATLVKGSATPRLESKVTATIHTLSARATGAALSGVEIVSATESHLSVQLFEALKTALSRKEKSILLLNRRGYYPYLYCQQCKESIQCPRCSVTLPLHKSGLLICHYCGFSRPDDGKCDRCHSPVKRLGLGTQRMEEILLQLFPDARIERLDTDSARNSGVTECIGRFLAGEIDILLGTQMIAKGLDSPDLTVVGVLKADQGLLMPDFRAAERTFALLTQVAGRAGRSKAGRVIFEAMDMDHPILKLAADQDYEAFFKGEIEDRRNAFYPPFSRIARLLVRSEDEMSSERDAARLADELRATGIFSTDPDLLGPAPAPIYRVNEQYRNHMIIKATRFEVVHATLKSILPGFRKTQKNSYLEIDLDPVDLL
ncbi:MAG: primosomal protein N' [Leptospirales bacterium]|nr:primosomal protein N' [Leptospirales bacterium]